VVHTLPVQTSPDAQGAQDRSTPHAGTVQSMQTWAALRSVAPAQPPHATVPLPHAFSIDPHFDPAPPSGCAHSGDGEPHTSPAAHPPQVMGTPHASIPMTPHAPLHAGVGWHD
jgi:hypothetical protein